MNLREAQKIAKIIGSADNGCSVCVNDLVNQLNNSNLGFHFQYTDKTLYIKSNDEEGEKIDHGIYIKVFKIQI